MDNITCNSDGIIEMSYKYSRQLRLKRHKWFLIVKVQILEPTNLIPCKGGCTSSRYKCSYGEVFKPHHLFKDVQPLDAG
jgi:hypothetical protein